MKRINVVLIYLTIALITTNYSFSNCDKSLVHIWPYTFGDYSSDFIYIDTCKDSPTYNELYQQGTWVITFRNYIFKDSIKIGNIAYLKDIDSTNFPKLYDALSKMESDFGKISFSIDFDNNGFNYSFSTELTVNIQFEKISRTRDLLYSLTTLPGSRNFWLKKNYQRNC